MLTIKQRANYSYIQDPTEHLKLIRKLSESTKVRAPGARFAKSFGVTWDGCYRFVSPHGRFLTGLTPLIVNTLKDLNEDVEVITPDFKIRSHQRSEVALKGVNLYKHQRQGANVALKRCRGVLEMATNAGKTEVAAYMILKLCNAGKILWLTHSLSLSDQTTKRMMKRTDISVSVCKEGRLDITGDIVVSTTQTMYKALRSSKPKVAARVTEFLKDIKVIFFDECQFGSAKTWMTIAEKCENAYYRYGLSGTPYTKDPVRNRRLIGVLGDTIYETTNKYMVENGYSCDVVVVSIPCNHHEYLSYTTAISEGVDRNDKRNELIVKSIAKLEKGNIGLILANHIEHTKTLDRLAKANGLKSRLVYGKHSVSYRNKAIDDLQKGKLDCLISTNIFDIGIDIPKLQWLFMAGPVQAKGRIKQRLGRVLRIAEGKKSAVVYYIDDKGDHYLEKSAKSIRTTLTKEGFLVV